MKLIQSPLLYLLTAVLYISNSYAEDKSQINTQSELNIIFCTDHSKFKPHKDFLGNTNLSAKMCNTYMGVGLSYKLKEDLFIDLKLGNFISRMTFNEDEVIQKENSPIYFATQVGVKYRLYQNSRFSIVFEPSVSFSRFKTVLNNWQLDGDLIQENRSQMINTLKLWSSRLIFEKKTNSTTPYAGIQLKNFNLKTIENITSEYIDQTSNNLIDRVKTSNKTSIRLNQKVMGIVLGMTHNLSKRSTLRIEGRLLNETALAVELNLRF